MKAWRWHLAQPDAGLITQLSQQLGCSTVFATCLANRGCTVENATAYLQPRLAHLSDPFLLPDMDLAVDRLLAAHEAGEHIVLFGDYDVDGVTATALLTEFFRALGWNCSPYLPHRMNEGYGLTSDGVENCLGKFPAKLVLAIDCGSTAVEVIQNLGARGIEVIVLDHHQVSSPAPAARALVNPQRLHGHHPLKQLCSAALAFKLAHAILKHCRSIGWSSALQFDLKPFLELVALGTIADIVPLRDENRIFVRTGLERLCSSSRPGIVALKKVAGVQDEVDCQSVAFQLAPRLNAAGRLETALAALELLLTEDPQQAQTLATELDTQNRQRQLLERKIADQVIAAVRARFDPAADFAIVEGDASWHLGVVGIVASRVLREFHRPVLILGSDGSDEWRGSGRSIEGFDLAAGLRECGDLLLKHGGHAAAAGLTIEKSMVEELRARFNTLVRSRLPAEALLPVLRIDLEVSLADLSYGLLQELRNIDPVGEANPPVHLAVRSVCAQNSRRFGANKQHLRFTATDGRSSHPAVWWNCDLPDLPASFDLAFVPEFNEYNGTLSIQLKVLDLKPLS